MLKIVSDTGVLFRCLLWVMLNYAGNACETCDLVIGLQHRGTLPQVSGGLSKANGACHGRHALWQSTSNVLHNSHAMLLILASVVTKMNSQYADDYNDY